MEQIQNELRENSGKRMKLSAARAIEKFAKHPQLGDDNVLEPSEDKKMSGGNVSMDTRLKRVVGAGKKGKGKLTITHDVEEKGASNGVMSGGAKNEGRMLAQHLMKLHGEGFFSDFLDGLKSVLKPAASVASMLPGVPGSIGKVASGLLGSGMPEQKVLAGMTRKGRGRPRKMAGGFGGTTSAPMGREVDHGLADSQLAPNTVAPVAYGNPPQAPASFRKNTVGMGKPAGKCGMTGGAKAPRKPSARGAMISKLMKEKGMTLGQASKHIKEHGGA
jgi:hypothetical protein